MVEQIHLAHMPPDLALYLAYYQNVSNAGFLRDQLLQGNQDFEYAFIDATMVISRKQVLAAAFRAMNDFLHERLKSRNIHSEVVFALSPNNNIGEAFRRFGVQETTKNIIVLKVATSPEVTSDIVRAHLSASIQGEEATLDRQSLQNVSDIGRIKKVYKLTSGQPSSGQKPSHMANGTPSAVVDERSNLEVQILGQMALRGAA